MTTDYITALAALHVTLADRTITLPAAELRRLARGRAYIGAGVAGIIRDGEIHASVSDAVRMADMRLSPPVSDAERAALRAAALAYIRTHARPAGSQYDPTFAAQWADYRALLAALAAE